MAVRFGLPLEGEPPYWGFHLYITAEGDLLHNSGHKRANAKYFCPALLNALNELIRLILKTFGIGDIAKHRDVE